MIISRFCSFWYFNVKITLPVPIFDKLKIILQENNNFKFRSKYIHLHEIYLQQFPGHGNVMILANHFLNTCIIHYVSETLLWIPSFCGYENILFILEIIQLRFWYTLIYLYFKYNVYWIRFWSRLKHAVVI